MEFNSDAGQAISLSLERKVPLLVLIDEGDGSEWFKAHFTGSETVEYLQSMVIKLRIEYKSQDYFNLKQFAPSIESLGGTGVVILFTGVVLAEIKRETPPNKIDTIISEISSKFTISKPKVETKPRISVKPKTVISKLIKEERKIIPKVKPRATTCLIQLKLLDGSTIRQKFEPNDKLHIVRSFILQSNPEYNNYHFYFFKPIERITLSDGDELRSVEDLDLNMSTLIIKLIDPQDASNPIEITSSSGSPFKWMKSTWESLWASENPQTSTLRGEGIPSIVNPDSLASQNDLLLDDDESDSASFHSARTVPLRPNMSSFSLYGSQGMLSSSQNLRNLAQRDITSSVENADSQQQQQQQQDTSPQDVGNGNNITLQRSTP